MSGYFLNFDKVNYFKEPRYEGCILCGLRDGDESLVNLSVHESKHFIISVNLYPYNPGHLLIYPRRHITDIRELQDSEHHELQLLEALSLNVLDHLRSPAGYNVGYNMGGSAGGSIEHLHKHIIPRYNREVGIADLVAGKRVLIESPFETRDLLAPIFAKLSS